jgi:hypothetical protein
MTPPRWAPLTALIAADQTTTVTQTVDAPAVAPKTISI